MTKRSRLSKTDIQHPFFRYIALFITANLISSICSGEIVIQDTFPADALLENTEFERDGKINNFWTPEIFNRHSKLIQEDGLFIVMEGAKKQLAAGISSPLKSYLDFFASPITITVDDLAITHEKLSNANQEFRPENVEINFRLGGDAKVFQSEFFGLTIGGDGGITIQTQLDNNLYTLDQFQPDDNYPVAFSLTLDESQYEAIFHYVDGSIKTSTGEHPITPDTWDADNEAALSLFARQTNNSQYRVIHSISELNLFQGEIWKELRDQHGRYSRSYSYMDWSKEAQTTGEQLAPASFSKEEYQTWPQWDDNTLNLIKDQKDVYISNVFRQIKWTNVSQPDTKTIRIHNCSRVVIENCGFFLANNDHRSENVIEIIDCDEVYIAGVWIGGSGNGHHISITNAKYVLVDGIHIEGINYDNGETRCGGGLQIANGQTVIVAPNLQFFVVQNSFFHNFTENHSNVSEHSAITIESGADGILFNNVIENWTAGDSAFNIGHDRTDEGYGSGHVIRAERNIVRNCNIAKAGPGISTSGNEILVCNNLFIDTPLYSAQTDYNSRIVHNTMIFDKNTDYVFSTGQMDFASIPYSICFENNLVHAKNRMKRIVNSVSPTSYIEHLIFDNNFYHMKYPSHEILLCLEDPSASIEDWENRFREYQNEEDTFQISWTEQPSFQDLSSDLTESLPNGTHMFVDAANKDYRLHNTSPAKHGADPYYANHNNIAMRVDYDFYGNLRDPDPARGAFE